MQKEDKKKISKEAKDLIKQGKSKQEVYDELVDKYKYRNAIADIVRFTPSLERLKKYSAWNTAFLIIVSLLTLLSIFNITLGIIWFVFIIIIVAMKKYKYYYWITILGAITIMVSFALYFLSGENGESDVDLATLIGSLIIAIIFILAGTILPKKITPPYTERKEKFIDKNGKQKLMVVHVFEKEYF